MFRKMFPSSVSSQNFSTKSPVKTQATVSLKIASCLLVLLISLNSIAQKKKKKDFVVSLKTPYGTMQMVLFDQTPKHKENFLKLVNQKFYDSLLFHRVMEKFMIQGGDPKSKKAKANEMLGSGDIGYKIPAEFVPELIHKKGALAAAQSPNPEKASSGCQFYIVQGQVWNDADFAKQAVRSGKNYTDEQKKIYQTIGGSPHLDNGYTVFGEVIDGLAIIDSIAKQPRDARNRPLKDIPMSMTAKELRIKKIRKLYPNYR